MVHPSIQSKHLLLYFKIVLYNIVVNRSLLQQESIATNVARITFLLLALRNAGKEINICVYSRSVKNFLIFCCKVWNVGNKMCDLLNCVKQIGIKLNNFVFSNLMSGVFILLFFITFIISLFIEIDSSWFLSLLGSFIAYLQLTIQHKDYIRWSWKQHCKCYKCIQKAADLLEQHNFDWNLSIIEAERGESYSKTIYPKFLEAVEIARVFLEEDTLKEVELIYEKASELNRIVKAGQQIEQFSKAMEITLELIGKSKDFYKLIRKSLAP